MRGTPQLDHSNLPIRARLSFGTGEDEGTAIFKSTNDPPVGRFCTYEGLPPDFYLTLTGLAGQYLRGDDVSFPEVTPNPK